MGGESGFEADEVADEPDVHVTGARREDRAGNDGVGRAVAAHGVDGDRHAHGRVLLLVNRSDLAPAVVAAIPAHGVWALGLMALRALADGRRPQRVMRAALGGSRLRVSSFGIRHRRSSYHRAAARL